MADFGKKRKWNDEGVPMPSKKIATHAPSPVENVSVLVVKGTDDWAPIVGMLNPRPSRSPIWTHVVLKADSF